MDLIDEVLVEDPSWVKRHDMHAYLFWLRTHEKGMLVTVYKNKIEAIVNRSPTMIYVNNVDEIRQIISRLEGMDFIEELYELYDPDVQVVHLIVIGDKSFAFASNYTLEEAKMWSEHIDCISKSV